MSNTLITGHLGYIGRHLHRALSPSHHVEGTDISEGGRDIQNGGAALPAGPHDAIVHLAAIASVLASTQLPLRTWGVNAGGTQALLSSLSCRGFKGRLVFASTLLAAVPDTSPYAGTKAACENMIRFAAKKYGFTAVILRIANVAGGGDVTPGRLLVEMAQAAADGSDFKIRTGYATTDGSTVRDFVHVLDVVEAITEALEVRLRPGHTITVEIGTGIGTSCLDAAKMFEAQGGHLNVVGAEAHPADVAVSVADPEPAACLLGWRAKRTVADIVREVAQEVNHASVATQCQ